MPPPKPVRILLVDDHPIPEQLQPCRQPVPSHPACLCPAARSGLPAAGCAGRPQHGVGAVVGGKGRLIFLSPTRNRASTSIWCRVSRCSHPPTSLHWDPAGPAAPSPLNWPTSRSCETPHTACCAPRCARRTRTAISGTCFPTVRGTAAACAIASTQPPYVLSIGTIWKPRVMGLT